MSTRSYVGIIKNGKVTYGYHHSDSHLESLGIELFRHIKTEEEANAKLGKYITHYDEEEMEYQDTIEDYFKIPETDIAIEFCYGFDVEENEWYVSSSHFTDASKIFKLTEIVQDDAEMEAYLDMYYEEYRDGLLKEIRDNIVDAPLHEAIFEFSTTISVLVRDDEDPVERAYKVFEDNLKAYGTDIFSVFDENGKGI